MWTGRTELQTQLDTAVDDLRLKLNTVQEVERNAVRAAMLEERARYCLFIGAIKPLIVRFTFHRYLHCVRKTSGSLQLLSITTLNLNRL